MSHEELQSAELAALPEFLKVLVRKGIIDLATAKRIELYRRSRELGRYADGSPYLLDPPDPSLTFVNFVRSKGNAFALDLAKVVTQKLPSEVPYNPIYIYGDSGLGKTHLLSAIANAACDKLVLMVNTADLEAEFDRARDEKTRSDLRQWLVSVEILLVDDVQLCEGREELQRDIFSILNHMTKADRWVVISSDVPPTELAGIESRLLSRLGGGVIVGLQMVDKEARREIIKNAFQDLRVSTDVLDYLAENLAENCRQLKGAVGRLTAMSELSGSEITLELAKSVFPPREAGNDRPPDPEPPSPEPPETELIIASPPPSTSFQTAFYSESTAERFKKMLAAAESEGEQALALQIALGERIRQLRKEGGDSEAVEWLEHALELVREGKTEDAVRWIST